MKATLLLCSDMHMDIDRANHIMANYPNFEWVSDYKISDVIIIMTCAFGEKKHYSMYVIANVLKNAKPRSMVIATGCLAKLNKAELEAIPNLRVKSLEEVFAMLNSMENKAKKLTNVSSMPSSTYSKAPKQVRQKIHQNVIIISNGCLKKCSYCVYPLLEESYTSKPIEEVLSEIRELSKTDEIIYLTGAHETSDYGVDLYGKRSFALLLEEACKRHPRILFGIGWFNPDGLTDEVIRVISEHKNVVHIMVHIQHNDNEILKNMKRACFEVTESKIKKLKEARPDIQISTEFIVGFPGETEECFTRLIHYLEGTRDLFQDIGVASYEPVMNTPAAALPNLPDYSVRQRRMEVIREKFNATSYPAPPDFKPLLSSYLEACFLLNK